MRVITINVLNQIPSNRQLLDEAIGQRNPVLKC